MGITDPVAMTVTVELFSEHGFFTSLWIIAFFVEMGE